METLNICIGTYRLAKGNGIDVSVYQFARELAKRHNVTLAIADTNMDIGEFDIIRYRLDVGAGIVSAAREIDKNKFDIISSHFPPFDLVASITHLPHYLHEPGLPPLRAFDNMKDKLFWAKVSCSRLFSLRRVQCVLPISEYLGREFKSKYFYRGPMKTLPYGIDFPEDEPSGGVPFKKYVLYVGRHAPYKGVHALLHIFKEVKREVKDAQLVTIGNIEKGYEARLKAIASSIDDVHMLGYVPDVWQYYKNAYVYATCSGWEGQDRPAIEAQYMGKPAVTFNNCSHPEIVMHGKLAKDRNEFRDALIEYLSWDHTDIGLRSRVKDRFSIQRMVAGFIDIVKRMG